jgi:hypothetical protein
MSIKLTETQVALLNRASQREDKHLTPPAGARLGPAKKAAAKLLEEGLVREVRARKDAPVWRRDESADQAFALKLTAAGLKAITIDAEGDANAESGSGAERRTESGGVVGSDARGIDAPDAGSGAVSSEEAPSVRIPRAGTKIDGVVAMLGREAGATIDEIVAETGWLPHTARAALTGLRKRGYALASDRSDRMRGTVYRIARGEAGGARGEADATIAAGSERGERTSHDAAGPVPAGADPEKPAEAARTPRKVRGAPARTRRAA